MSKTEVYTYDPKKVSILLDGRALTGFAADGKVTITKNADNITPAVGVNGDVAYAINADDTAIAAIPLLSTSASLAWIRKKAAQKQLISLMISDSNDNDPVKVNCQDCMIQKTPDITRTKEAATITVNVYIPSLDVK